MPHDNSLFSKVGSATIATLAGGVNTLLTPTTMGGEKFHITVTIENEKAIAKPALLKFVASKFFVARHKSAITNLSEESRAHLSRRGAPACNFSVTFSL
jgi:hypothetical protein